MLLEEGIELKELLKGASMEVPSFVKVAIAMTKLVQTAHYRKVIIGNLNPTGVQIQPDMNLAVLVENRDPDYAYLAPEQTGRINREPDERSDLYALGMIFYEMLAGRLPFQAHSAEEWVHAHLAIVPSPLRELHPEMPGTLEDMIMKLLSKSPDDRYQSAYGLLADLKQCASSLQERGEIILFEIARTDQASQFRLPHKLFGREAEEAKLREALETARIGAAEFVLVTGRAGSGKTALIRELQLPIIREGGQFIAGKCDQMIRDIPFAPILQALRRLIRQVSSESPERVAKLKARLAEALDHGAGVIAEFLPEAANLLGDYPVVEPLAPAQAAIRLRRLIPIFIKIFAHSEHALVMFLDDLQWADPATLDVLRTLAHDSTLHGLLFIGAYRIETTFSYTESGETQAAALWIENAFDFQQSEGSLRVQHIALDPLFYVDVRHFVSFIFNENTTRIRLLAELLYHQTGGNPLHLHRLLDSLYREKRIYYDEERARWTWDVAAIRQMPENPDVLLLIANQLRKLPHETIGLLAIAAAIGYRFRPATIALVSGHSLPDTLNLLHSAEEEALICQENDADEVETDNSFYTFLHDRVQQASYKTVLETEQASLHLKIGRVMRDNSFNQQEESIFDLVYHLNLGRVEVVDEAEKRELAAFNLQAGLKSKATTAFATALHFLKMGLQLLGEDKAGTDSLAYRLMLEQPECEYMCGRTDRAELLLDQLMNLAPDRVERSRIYVIRIRMNAYLERDAIAVQIGLQALAEFGWKIPVKPSKADVVKETVKTKWALYRMGNKLPELPVNRDPHYKALSDLVMSIASPAFNTSSDLIAMLFPRFVRYGMKLGNNEAFSYMLGVYGMLLNIAFPRKKAGYHLAETAQLLSASIESSALQCRLYVIRGLIIQYRNPERAVEHFEQSVRYGLESSDLAYLSRAMHTHITTHLGDLQSLSAQITYYEEVSRQLVDKDTLKLFGIAKSYIAELKGTAGKIDEISASIESNPRHRTINTQAFYICTCKMLIAYLTGEYREGLKWAERGKAYSFHQTSLQIRMQHVYQSLTLAALYWEAPPEECDNIRKLLKKQLRYMTQRPGFFGQESSAYLLITAELQRIEGSKMAAIQGFEEAIRAARSEGYELMEAIACERASICYREAGIVAAADALLTDACAVYSRWGAAAKVSRLREVYSELPLSISERQEDRVEVAQEAGQNKAVREMAPFIMDEKALIQQISGWSSTADNQDVMNRFLELALRYSGAERGCVLNSQEKNFFIEAQTGSWEDTTGAPSYAEAIVRYVVNSGEPVVLANASQSSYAADAYIRRCQPQSVLCMPVLFPGKSQSDVLYLENNLISSVFTKERLEVLDLMITRMFYLKALEESREQISVSNDSSRSAVDVSAQASQLLVDSLTNREMEILYALSDGLSNKEIAYRFGLTEATVKTHLTNLYGKLGVNSRLQAIAKARELKLLQ